MSINNIYNSKVVYSENIKKRQANVLASMEDVGIHGFFDDGYAKYKPFFKKLTDILRKTNYISFRYMVSSMWFTDSRLCSFDEINPNLAYFNLSLYDSNYNEIQVTSGNYRDMSKYIKPDEETLALILDECVNLINTIKQMREDAKKLPEINELIVTLLSYAQKHVNEDLYTVDIEKGKLNMESNDTEPYNCLVVRHKDNNEYHSSIVFSKNDIGEYFATQRVPLCGQNTIQFSLETAEEQIKKIINF